jgi:hypothetical protein
MGADHDFSVFSFSQPFPLIPVKKRGLSPFNMVSMLVMGWLYSEFPMKKNQLRYQESR